MLRERRRIHFGNSVIVDALSAAKKSGRKARGTTASLPILNRASQEVPHEVASSADQKAPVAQHSASTTGS